MLSLSEIRAEFLKYGITSCGAALLNNEDSERLIKEGYTVFTPKYIIVALFPYSPDFEKGNISIYASLPDYHRVAGGILKLAARSFKAGREGCFFMPFADNSPINEVKYAVDCGLGGKGRNNLLLSNEHGSFCFIGEIITDCCCEISRSADNPCDSCGACIKACPTGALTKDGFNKPLCLSDITQKRGELTEFEKDAIAKSGCAWGCDICQLACPKNKGKGKGLMQLSSHVYSKLNVSDIEGLTNRQFKDKFGDYAFSWRGKRVLLRNLHILDKGKRLNF